MSKLISVEINFCSKVILKFNIFVGSLMKKTDKIVILKYFMPNISVPSTIVQIS